MKILVSVMAIVLLIGGARDENQEDQKLAFKEKQVVSYRNVLERRNISSTVFGARDYLVRLIPSEETKEEIRHLVEKLSGSRFKGRVEAEEQLSTMGPVVLASLKEAVKSGDPETRMRAKRAITAVDQHAAELINAAINVLKYDPTTELSLDQRLDTYFKLCRGTTGFGIESELRNAIIFTTSPDLKQRIVNGVKDKNLLIRNSCIRALKLCVVERELRDFLYLTQSTDSEDSLAAIECFGFLEPTQSVELLISRHLNSSEANIRRQAINLLRALSGENFGFRVDGKEEEREVVINQWTEWLAKNKPVSVEVFERMLAASNKSPTGFLISVIGKGIRKYSLNGELEWQIDGNTYDAQHINSNLVLVTFRKEGKVKLLRDRKVVQEVGGLISPSDAEYLRNGNILSLQSNGVITEYDPSGKTVKKFEGFSNPFDVDRLQNGNTLIADSNNNRIVEIDSTGETVWECQGLDFPNNAFRLPDGRTLYTTFTAGIVGLIGTDGTVIWSYKIKGSTLYSVYCAQGKIYVADGANRKIWILDLSGELIGGISLPETFCDVNFVTE